VVFALSCPFISCFSSSLVNILPVVHVRWAALHGGRVEAELQHRSAAAQKLFRTLLGLGTLRYITWLRHRTGSILADEMHCQINIIIRYRS